VFKCFPKTLDKILVGLGGVQEEPLTGVARTDPPGSFSVPPSCSEILHIDTAVSAMYSVQLIILGLVSRETV
jgi:hypothetical protein